MWRVCNANQRMQGRGHVANMIQNWQDIRLIMLKITYHHILVWTNVGMYRWMLTNFWYEQVDSVVMIKKLNESTLVLRHDTFLHKEHTTNRRNTINLINANKLNKYESFPISKIKSGTNNAIKLYCFYYSRIRIHTITKVIWKKKIGLFDFCTNTCHNATPL